MTYYMPVPQGVQHKATIFYVHGYGAYAGEFAFYLREFANQGYQVFGMDQRGFGHSEGERGLFESDD
jgi:alpha-beta hydrolase superfamily lysophospholipase